VQQRERVEQAWQSWQASKDRFTEAARILPGLIADVEDAVRAHRYGSDPAARREVLQVAADLYGLLRSYCRRTGRLDLSLMVADRAMRAAEDADDPVRIAAAAWNLGHVLLSHNELSAVEEAKEVAVLAVEQLRRAPATLESSAVEGALELVAVVSDARRRQWWEARRRRRLQRARLRWPASRASHTASSAPSAGPSVFHIGRNVELSLRHAQSVLSGSLRPLLRPSQAVAAAAP